ncbi:FAD dependent oxidoreductase [Armillaria fumosa]|nr:FAD dependent oxidoreductase [Armillaria fumosa]
MSSPGFPGPNACLSFWLQGVRSSPLIGHRTTEELPTTADVVIIGSGITGASTAYFLLTGEDPPKSVVVLEAREMCDGATGRNGGHCRPDCYRGYSKYKAAFGKEQALKVIQNEMDNLNLVTEFIEEEKIDCDWWQGKSFDVAMDQECAEQLINSYKAFKADGGPVDGIIDWYPDPVEARRLTRIPEAVLAAAFPAASLYPYKLVSHLFTQCIEKHGLNLQTSTPATAVNPAPNGGWIIETPRGSITATKVVYATNAFTATLLPEFIGGIVPIRGQCSAIIPTKAYSGKNMLAHTCSYQWGNGGYDYMIQRPKDGIIIIGGGMFKVPDSAIVGQTDDSVKLPEITEHLKTAMPTYFENWGAEAMGEGLIHDWTGTMGYTPEMVPFVGELHDKPGAFICAGHAGHGMARILACAKGLAALIQGEPWEKTKIPECFQPTPERLAKFSDKTIGEEQ